jgi:hypothetical protein
MTIHLLRADIAAQIWRVARSNANLPETREPIVNFTEMEEKGQPRANS